MVSEVGRTLATLKAETGLTWDRLADAIGASSGDYVRKVASGARPGQNLARAVGELMATGQVSSPVPRRTTRAGTIARVRAPRAAGTPSRVPAPTRVAATDSRSFFRTPRGRIGWAQNVGGADDRGLRQALASAGRGGKRVHFRVRVPTSDGHTRWVTIGQKGGYRPRDIPRRGDLRAWLGGQIVQTRYGAEYEENDLAEIEVIAE